MVALSLVAAVAGSLGPVSAAPSDPTVALVSWPDGDGYLVVSRSGRLWTFGSAVSLGSPSDLGVAGVDLVAVATRSAADGYWMFGSDGGVFAYGNAAFHGSAASLSLRDPMVGATPTAAGDGYWMVAADGGIFAYGNAAFSGSAATLPLRQPVVAMSSTPGGGGYWLVASDGGVFAYGDAEFHGSAATLTLASPIIGMLPTFSGSGYWLFASDGGVFAYGDAGFFGSGASTGLAFSAMAPTPDLAGYRLLTNDGQISVFGAATDLGSPADASAACDPYSANTWPTLDVSDLPVHSRSSAYIASIGVAGSLHPDFGTVWNGAPNGIPFVTVDESTPLSDVTFLYADESDPGPYPIPDNAPIEGGPDADGDRHILLVNKDDCVLHELFDARPPATPGGAWSAGSGARFDMSTWALRPDGWTSADAAGLPIWPLLVRYDEVASGRIDHAIRITVPRTQRAYLHPATHFASSDSNPDLPPMGLRMRLRADFDISGFPAEVQVILTAMKTYGVIVADNGSAWFVSGAPDPRWDDDALATMRDVPGSAFEVVDTGEPLRP
ncbi:hypothetical protein JYT35_00390 [Acidimicrobium ferrooxidans]|uniref:Uncharacterized protein n=1 Tax=Acidimicrobium ferrooxidans TaxID=53635 RepID=A0ABS3APT9_9ACTN|nr:hypothetical protein [Acidimicrobium ferrooxidans]